MITASGDDWAEGTFEFDAIEENTGHKISVTNGQFYAVMVEQGM